MSGLTMLLFLIFPFLFLWFGWLPADMDFIEFSVHWLPMALAGISIYLYVQRWLCHPDHERGLHWRGMFLKFACWYVFLKGFVLSLLNKEIPYIPTAKKAVGGFSRFARPLLVHQFAFLLTVILVLVQRIYFTPEAKRALSSGEIWGMVAFAGIAFLMTLGGTYAAIQSSRIKAEEPWSKINLKLIDEKASQTILGKKDHTYQEERL
jgi:cellulose synthase (UDP-forming)